MDFFLRTIDNPMSSANTIEPMPVNKNDNRPALWDLVIDDFKRHFVGSDKTKSEIIALMTDRDQFGYNKYNCRLKTHNGRNFKTDLTQEILDAICYTQGLIEENEYNNEIIKDIYQDLICAFIRLYEAQKINHE